MAYLAHIDSARRTFIGYLLLIAFNLSVNAQDKVLISKQKALEDPIPNGSEIISINGRSSQFTRYAD